MKLSEHIERYHNGSMVEFAKSIGKHRAQVWRWLKMGCIYVDGDVYENKSKTKPREIK